ncbi:MAG: alternative ribosome rescue aminoacyl-tRNA hydrolase ArfB [Microthrixaceae bacterium]
MPEDLRVSGGLTIPGAELSERFMPSGGPGGQHANRSNTRVELRFDAAASTALSDYQRSRIIELLGDDVRVVVDDERSQHRNRDIARDRLAGRLRNALTRETKRRPTKPSRGAKERRLKEKKRRSEIKAQRRPPTD